MEWRGARGWSRSRSFDTGGRWESEEWEGKGTNLCLSLHLLWEIRTRLLGMQGLPKPSSFLRADLFVLASGPTIPDPLPPTVPLTVGDKGRPSDGVGESLCVCHFSCLACLLPRWLSEKESACKGGDAGDVGSIPGSGRSPGEGNGNLLQYSCLRSPWTEETGGLTSRGSQTVRHDLATKHQHAHFQLLLTF